MNPALRVVVVAIAAAALAALLLPVYLTVRAGDNKVFEAQPFDFALVAIAAFVIAVGVQTVPWRAATNVTVLGTLVGAGLLFGALAIFSVGVLVLPVAVVLLVVLWRAIGRAPLSVARRAALGGAVVGYGLILLFIALIIPPTVECFANGGGSTSSQRWGQSGGGFTTTSSGSSTIDGVQTGTIESPSSTVTYRCEQGRMVQFRREPR
ncbi:MAG: hypothetical protein M3T56_00220 [Chloroflexota bacterium]|nr:hypothetical protein [Chloroflexota bacterium]